MVKRITGRTLQTLRARLLYDEPLCVHCTDKGKLSLAVEIDHIVPLYKGGSNDQDNLQGLCVECHQTKTVADMGYRARVTIGVDGWPVEQPYENLANPVGMGASARPLTVIFGSPAAGKTTLANDLATQSGATVYDLDDYYKRGAHTVADALRLRNADLVKLSRRTTGEYILIVSAPTAVERAWWVATLRPAKTVLVMCDEATCLTRAGQRVGVAKASSIKGVASWWAAYTPDDTPIHSTDRDDRATLGGITPPAGDG